MFTVRVTTTTWTQCRTEANVSVVENIWYVLSYGKLIEDGVEMKAEIL
jgi:hypothetical protein